MGSFLHRKSNYEHQFTDNTNTMNTLIAIVTVLDIEVTNWRYSQCDFRHIRPICLSEFELG